MTLNDFSGLRLWILSRLEKPHLTWIIGRQWTCYPVIALDIHPRTLSAQNGRVCVSNEEAKRPNFGVDIGSI